MRDLLDQINETAGGRSTEIETLVHRGQFYTSVVDRISTIASNSDLVVRFWKGAPPQYILEGTRAQFEKFEQDMSGSFGRNGDDRGWGWTAHFSAGMEMYIGYHSGSDILSTTLERGMERRVLVTPNFPWPELRDFNRN